MTTKQKIFRQLIGFFFFFIALSTQAQIGTPLNPTYGNVKSTASADYYDQLIGLSGTDLINTLKTIVVNSTTKGQTYGDVWYILDDADENPANSSQVWEMYKEVGIAKTDKVNQVSWGWNREHIFPQTRGGFKDGTSNSSDGIDVYFSTSSSQITHAHGDAHHLRAEDVYENSSRGDLDFGNVSGPRTKNSSFYEPPLSAKGDIARSLFYMAVRYDALSLGNGDQDGQVIGDLSAFIQWNELDPPDDFEMRRNNVIYTWQNNRNPFIDLPELVDYIWGDKQGQPWPGNAESYISVSPELAFSTTIFGLSSEIKSYQVSGAGLGTTLSIDAPTHFEISMSNNPATFAKHIEITITDGTLTATDVFVRFTPESAVGETVNGTINHASGTLSAQLAVSGIEGSVPPEPIEIYTQNFETGCAPDWTKYSVSSNKNWDCGNYGHNTGIAIAINNFNADANSEDWLISPKFNLASFSSPEFKYWIATDYSGSVLQLMYSTNYIGTGNPNAATWTKLKDIDQPAEWTEDSFDLSSLGQTSYYLAFKHTSGKTSGSCSRINLDDISLFAVESGTSITTSTSNLYIAYTAPGETSQTVSYTVTGQALQGNINISCELPFELSLDENTWETTLNIQQTEASNKQVFVRFRPTENYLGKYTGTIQHNSLNAIQKEVLVSAAGNPDIPVDAGTLTKDETLDIVSWNLEWFGAPQKSGHATTFQQQLSAVSSTIISLDADIYALQEVVADALNGNYLDTLLTELNCQAGAGVFAALLGPRYSFDNYEPTSDYPAQRICYIYRTNIISNISSESMFSSIYPSPNVLEIPGYTGNPYEFWSSGRLPFLLEADVTIDGLTVPFSFVNIHAKCCEDSYDRKKADALFLKDELDENFDHKNVIILGDYNDYLTGSMSGGDSPYSSWFAGSNEDFLPALSRQLDHISISNELYFEHQSLTNNTMIGSTNISDHKPLLLRLKLDTNNFDGQTITFNEISDKPIDAEPFEIIAESSKDLPVEYEMVSGPATLSGNVLTVTGLGTVVVKAYNEGDQNTLAASTQTQFDVLESTSLVPEIKKLSFSIYPNPSDGLLTISHQLNEKDITVKIYATSGKLVESHRLNGSTLDLQHLKPGFYIISIETNKEVGSKIWIKK